MTTARVETTQEDVAVAQHPVLETGGAGGRRKKGGNRSTDEIKNILDILGEEGDSRRIQIHPDKLRSVPLGLLLQEAQQRADNTAQTFIGRVRNETGRFPSLSERSLTIIKEAEAAQARFESELVGVGNTHDDDLSGEPTKAVDALFDDLKRKGVAVSRAAEEHLVPVKQSSVSEQEAFKLNYEGALSEAANEAARGLVSRVSELGVFIDPKDKRVRYEDVDGKAAPRIHFEEAFREIKGKSPYAKASKPRKTNRELPVEKMGEYELSEKGFRQATRVVASTFKGLEYCLIAGSAQKVLMHEMGDRVGGSVVTGDIDAAFGNHEDFAKAWDLCNNNPMFEFERHGVLGGIQGETMRKFAGYIKIPIEYLDEEGASSHLLLMYPFEFYRDSSIGRPEYVKDYTFVTQGDKVVPGDLRTPTAEGLQRMLVQNAENDAPLYFGMKEVGIVLGNLTQDEWGAIMALKDSFELDKENNIVGISDDKLVDLEKSFTPSEELEGMMRKYHISLVDLIEYNQGRRTLAQLIGAPGAKDKYEKRVTDVLELKKSVRARINSELRDMRRELLETHEAIGEIQDASGSNIFKRSLKRDVDKEILEFEQDRVKLSDEALRAKWLLSAEDLDALIEGSVLIEDLLRERQVEREIMEKLQSLSREERSALIALGLTDLPPEAQSQRLQQYQVSPAIEHLMQETDFTLSDLYEYYSGHMNLTDFVSGKLEQFIEDKSYSGYEESGGVKRVVRGESKQGSSSVAHLTSLKNISKN